MVGHEQLSSLFKVLLITPVAIDFFNQINMVYGCVSEFCTNESCDIMNAGKKYEYLLWPDAKRGTTKPTPCTAPEYVAALMEWIEVQLDKWVAF